MRSYKNIKEEYERGFLAGRRAALREQQEEDSIIPKFKRLGLKFNRYNNTWDWEEGSVAFGFTEEKDLDYFRITEFKDDKYPDKDLVMDEMKSRIKDLNEALEIMAEI